jgi:aldehyde dehydrogenase (NAD+)
MTSLKQNYIAGEWVQGADVNNNINPSDISDVVGEFARGSASDVEAAVSAANAALSGWANASPQVRHDVLDAAGNEILARKDEIGALLSREEGKTLNQGKLTGERTGKVIRRE